MSLAPARLPPTRGERRGFAAMLALLAVALFVIVAYRPRALFAAAAALGLGWAVSLVCRAEHRGRWSVGTGMPLLLAALASLAVTIVPARGVAVAVGAGFVGLAAGVLASPSFGRALRDGWMEAVAPMSWTASHAVLAAIYFAVLTPVGFVLRVSGRDPLRLRRSPEPRTGWLEHSTPSDFRRYFRQF